VDPYDYYCFLLFLYERIYYGSITTLRVITRDSMRRTLPLLPPTPGQFTSQYPDLEEIDGYNLGD
jgi:hypothetical protein